MTPIELQGFVADVRYAPQLTSRLTIYTRDDFDINRAAASGIIEFGNDRLAYSKWVGPKRTRSYPFARIYDTYHLNTKKITIILIIKDEGANGDNDRINFITWSWMNLLNVYIVLAWYDTAQAHHTRLNCVTEQQFDTEYVRAKIDELAIYQASALHWNTSHFQKDFEPTLMKAVQSYEMIGQVTGAKMHASAGHRRFLQRCQEDGVFTLAGFKQATLTPSLKASLREVKTMHKREFLEGVKAIITVKNYLGGVYYLTVDEVISTQDGVILQESKNNDKGERLPKMGDIKDGLFKLILFSNLERLIMGTEAIAFEVRLCLTGKVIGQLLFPNTEVAIDQYIQANQFTTNETALLHRLNAEASMNPMLSILVRANQ